jgi:hypothetical protein
MAEMEEIRLEALKGLTILAIHDEQFRSRVIDDLEGTLRRYGYALNEQEMQRVRYAHEEIAGMTAEDLARELSDERAIERAIALTEEEVSVLSPDEQYLRSRWR